VSAGEGETGVYRLLDEGKSEIIYRKVIEMKVLVLATDYPNNDGGVALMYVHARNKYYMTKGIDVTVLNFSTQSNYKYEDIPVISLKEYEKNSGQYELLIVHAANLRNHYIFLKKYGDRFPRFLFFFHGHEVLKVRETYSVPYPYVKNRGIKDSFVQDIYDEYKLSVWKKYYEKVEYKSKYIFVSGWMRDKFERYVKLDTSKFHTYIIPNNIGEVFEKQSYDVHAEKEYDFITIRGNLDGSKYCIDVINRLAQNNPDLKFLLVGKGEYFKHFHKASNITWLEKGLPQHEIPAFLDKAKCALMPTRLDAQGVMMCEMASYGIPLITSDIDICQEISRVLNNVIMIDNDETVDLKAYLPQIESLYGKEKNKYFFAESTVGREVDIIEGRL
jgi:glycosyltransferase involved in cell wall biosynthesis